MLHRTTALTSYDSCQINKEKHNRNSKPVSRPPVFKENIAPKARLTHDIHMSREEKELDNMSKFKQVILKERSANIKNYHLKVKDQDDMIKQMRSKMAENKSNEKSLVNSRCTAFQSQGGKQTSSITKKLSILERNICNKKRLERSSSRTRYLLSRTQSNSHIEQAKETLFTPIEQLTVIKLPEKLSSQLLKVDQNLKKLLQANEEGRKKHQTLRQQCSLSQQEIQTAIATLADLQIQKQKQAQQLEAANQRYKQIQQNIQQRIQRQRNKYLMGTKCYYVRDIKNSRVSM